MSRGHLPTHMADPIYAAATDLATLASSWNSLVRVGLRDDGALLTYASEISLDKDAFLNDIAEALAQEPASLMADTFPHSANGNANSSDGGHNTVATRFVIRLIETALLSVLERPAELLQASCSYGSRLGIGSGDAIEHLFELRENGTRHVIRTRVHDYASQKVASVGRLVIAETLKAPRTAALITLLQRARRQREGPPNLDNPTCQMTALDKLIANLALTRSDHTMLDAGCHYVRFDADITLAAKTIDQALTSLRQLNDVLESDELVLDQEATMLTNFDEGFCYLGEDLTATRPAPKSHAGLKGEPCPDKVIYVGKDGARVHIAKQRLIVDSPDGIPQVSVPSQLISRLVLTGAVGLSAGARSWALRNDIDVICLSRRGGYLGQLAGPRSTVNARRLLAQAEFSATPSVSLPLGKAIVQAKIRNQLHVLHRTGRRSDESGDARACYSLRQLMSEAEYAGNHAELMGIEGAASTEYFAALSGLVPDNVRFSGRSRRPPKDLANAALSYAYAILLGECTGALFAAGLEPSLGVLHASTDKRPSLALDLMEEFRPLLVDRTVIALLRQRRLRPEHASQPDADGAVWLNREGKKIVVDGYEATLQRSVNGALPGFAGTWRRHIHHEAQLLGRAIMEADYQWRGVAWR